MSTQTLETVRNLINENRYDEARSILLRLDHPIATKWLAKLERIAPSQISRPAAQDLPDTQYRPTAPPQNQSYAPQPQTWSRPPEPAYHPLSSRWYVMVRVLAYFYYLVGSLVFIVGSTGGIYLILSSSRVYYGAILLGQGVTTLIGSLLFGVTFLAVGQTLEIILELVYNSRKQIHALDTIANRLAQSRL